jgi:hypothetical protein
MSWKPEVIVTGEGDKWLSNQLRFASEKEALDNARDLFHRWMLAKEYRAVECDDPVNYSYIDGQLEQLVS